jgi:hypothetical protein
LSEITRSGDAEFEGIISLPMAAVACEMPGATSVGRNRVSEEDLVSINISYQPTNLAASRTSDDEDIHENGKVGTAIVLLLVMLALYAVISDFNTAHLLSESFLVGP